MAKIKPEFDLRGVKVIGLSVDSTADHERWGADIEETQGTRPNCPVIGDEDYTVAKLYGMLPGKHVRGRQEPHARGQPDRPQSVRHRAGQEDQADPRLPHDDRTQGEDVIIAGSVPNSEARRSLRLE